MEKITITEFQKYLDEVIACDAFEFHKSEKKDGVQSFYIPYMMNDALECYLMLENGTMTGEYDPENKDEVSAEFVETDKGQAVIFRQGQSNVFTVWFQECYRVLQCYRYDQIGHFWVDGMEHWRRLVYIVGTIYDKYNYMGEAVCNRLELELLPLMEFAPFRYFSPIHDSLDNYYEDRVEGLEVMRKLAEEAGDKGFLRLMKLYEIVPFKRQCTFLLVQAMMKPARNSLYELIFQKVQCASAEYPERVYPDGVAKEIAEKRASCASILKQYGFSGTYPLFEKLGIQILAMEEHPFTILESDQYKFKIQCMVSEIKGNRRKAKENSSQVVGRYPINAGFFKGNGLRGWIEKDLDFLG